MLKPHYKDILIIKYENTKFIISLEFMMKFINTLFENTKFEAQFY